MNFIHNKNNNTNKYYTNIDTYIFIILKIFILRRTKPVKINNIECHKKIYLIFRKLKIIQEKYNLSLTNTN